MKENDMGKPAKAIPPQDVQAVEHMNIVTRIEPDLRLVRPVLNTSHEEQSPYVPANRH